MPEHAGMLGNRVNDNLNWLRRSEWYWCGLVINLYVLNGKGGRRKLWESWAQGHNECEKCDTSKLQRHIEATHKENDGQYNLDVVSAYIA